MTQEQALDLEAILAEHGLDMAVISRVLDVSMTTVRHWKMGRRKPSIEHCKEAEAKLKIPKYKLRPDLWPPPAPAPVDASRSRRKAA